MPNIWRRTKPIKPLPLSTTTFILYSSSFLNDRIYPHARVTPSTTRIIAAMKSVSPDGQMLASVIPRPKETTSKLRTRRSARHPLVQHFGLNKIGTSVSRKLTRWGYSSIYGSTEKCYGYFFSGVYSTISAQPMLTRISARSETMLLLTPISVEPAAKFCWCIGYSRPS